MTIIRTFSIAKDVEELLNRVPKGHISETINEAIRQFFEIEPPTKTKHSTEKRSPRKEKDDEIFLGSNGQPVTEISINDL